MKLISAFYQVPEGMAQQLSLLDIDRLNEMIRKASGTLDVSDPGEKKQRDVEQA